mmetsp:Transcript_6459/g.7393  ORF Transcript_6459/g.7393 Transcript_6459/m.7393 type:complete len:275 (+) Transcript_6459:219-1043(+)
MNAGFIGVEQHALNLSSFWMQYKASNIRVCARRYLSDILLRYSLFDVIGGDTAARGLTDMKALVAGGIRSLKMTSVKIHNRAIYAVFFFVPYIHVCRAGSTRGSNELHADMPAMQLVQRYPLLVFPRIVTPTRANPPRTTQIQHANLQSSTESEAIIREPLYGHTRRLALCTPQNVFFYEVEQHPAHKHENAHPGGQRISFYNRYFAGIQIDGGHIPEQTPDGFSGAGRYQDVPWSGGIQPELHPSDESDGTRRSWMLGTQISRFGRSILIAVV